MVHLQLGKLKILSAARWWVLSSLTIHSEKLIFYPEVHVGTSLFLKSILLRCNLAIIKCTHFEYMV